MQLPLQLTRWRRGAVAVLPFRLDRGADGVAAPPLNGENCARLLADALARWQSLRLTDEMRVADAWGARDAATLDAARAVARRLGAGRFVWGTVSTQGSALRVSAHLYDTRDGHDAGDAGVTGAARVVFVAADGDAGATLAALADSLVSQLAGASATPAAAGGTRNFDALKHYADGYAALHRWDTPAAERHFRAAVDLDPAFAPAHLALAQTMGWSARYPARAWREPAARALADSAARLAPRDRALAAALLALAEGRMRDACDTYRALIARAPDDFAAQYGLGECLSRDKLVVRDPARPGGWQFRGGYAEAVVAYRRALELVPSYFEGARGATFTALARRVLRTDDTEYRDGFALAPDTVWMGALPELVGDTVTYHPVPLDALFRGAEPPSHRAAVARNRETLRTLTARWTDAYPQSALAWQHHAQALESAGMLDAASPGAPGALQAIERARRLSVGDTEGRASAQTAAVEVRVLLKLRRVDRAVAVAGAALADTARVAAALGALGALGTSGDRGGADILAALAALTGRASLAARFLERAALDTGTALLPVLSAREATLPAPVLRAAGVFAAYAALAAPVDSVRVTRARLERAVDTWASPAARERVRAIVLARSSMLAQPTLGAAALRGLREPEPYDDLLVQWQTLAAGDTNAVRRAITAVLSSPVPGAARAPDWLVQRAQLALAVRDTTTAVTPLDELLASLPDQAPRLTEEVPATAALGRALVLRALLPNAGPTPARAARTLWANGDAALRAIATSLPARQR